MIKKMKFLKEINLYEAARTQKAVTLSRVRI
jgi:hypothetical protein